MIIDIKFLEKHLRLTTDDGLLNKSENIYTVITGKNGIGKSRLLSAISLFFISNDDRKKIIHNPRESLEKNHCEMSYDHPPHKIISVSTSPFDKFPLPKRRENISNYSYLGLRGLSSVDLSAEYISKITFKLISAVINQEIDMSRIASVLNYLGYHDHIEITVNARYSSSRASEIISSENKYEFFERIFLKGIVPSTHINRSLFINDNGDLNEAHIDYALDSMLSIASSRMGSAGTVMIDTNGASLISDAFILDEKFMFLLEAGILITRNIHLHKKNSKQMFSIKNASSGEQCILMSLLGIASQISDNCVICIDEPEVCLHPEWQERYISILMDTFKDYKKCHFIIATHSPQITSKLNSKNCFIISLQDQETYNASSIMNRSIDFQLATIFKAPGYKNEYLTRELVNFLAELTTEKKTSKEKLSEIKKIITLKPFISESDPVRKLIYLAEKSIKEIK
ncbi:AAA family ATPase [Pantoea agglomerans]|uniref:AAA family ATPase n=1 Tax=Enterobacter agglomerans TaxID=549 RepID=UPI003C7A87DB